MKGISPIVSKVTYLLTDELKKDYFLKESNKIYINKKSLNYDHTLFNVDKWILNLISYNSYDHSKSGLDKNNKYVVYINLSLENLTIDGLLHEVKHAYVDWCIYKSGGRPIRETKEVKRFYTEDLEKLLLNSDLDNIKKIVMSYYFCSNLEIPAFLENHYFDKTYINYFEKISEISNFNFSEFLNEQTESEFFELRKTYKIPFFRGFNTYSDFINHSEKYLKKRSKNILKKIEKIDEMIDKNLKK
jgi:hypothetical protein